GEGLAVRPGDAGPDRGRVDPLRLREELHSRRGDVCGRPGGGGVDGGAAGGRQAAGRGTRLPRAGGGCGLLPGGPLTSGVAHSYKRGVPGPPDVRICTSAEFWGLRSYAFVHGRRSGASRVTHLYMRDVPGPPDVRICTSAEFRAPGGSRGSEVGT